MNTKQTIRSSTILLATLTGLASLMLLLVAVLALESAAPHSAENENIASKRVTSPNAGFNNSFAFSDTVTYMIKITNTGKSSIDERMTDLIPNGLQAISITEPGELIDDNTLARFVGTIAPSQTITMILVTQVISNPQSIPDTIINRVRLNSGVIYDAPEIAVLPPLTATITGIQFVGVGQENIYTVMTNQDEYIESYRWEVGGAVVANTSMLNHTFDTAGEIQVTATVTNGIGLVQTDSMTVTVFAEPEVTLDAPAELLMGVAADYSATFDNSDLGGVIVNWAWHFGDDIINTTTNSVTYTFSPDTTDPFTATVRVVATNSVGLTGTDTAEVSVQPQLNYLPAILRETCEDPDEPNNDPADATDLANGMSTFGAFTACGDETNLDYFTFELDATSSIVIDLTNISTGANLDLILYRDPPPNPPLAGSAQAGSVDERLEMNNLPAGTYYILVLGTELLDPITTYQVSWDFQ